MRKIPVVIIAGFLGSGKTTLINHLLSSAKGTRIGVIVNDFGSVSIDSILVSQQADELVELASGCICCMMDGNSLEEPLKKLAHPDSNLDAIIIEASGLAEPREITHKVHSAKNPFSTYGGLVYIIDAVNFPSLYADHKSQISLSISTADLIAVNKSDLVPNTEQIDTICKEFAPNTPIVRISHGKLNPKLLFDVRKNINKQLPLINSESNSHTAHVHHGFSSYTFESTRPLDPKSFTNFINALPPAIYRAKGIIYFGLKGLEQKYTFQKVGSFKDISPSEWRESETPSTKLVFIGTGFDKTKLEQNLSAIIDSEPNHLTPENTIRLN